MTTPQKTIARTLEAFIRSKGPIIATDISGVAERVYRDLVAEKNRRSTDKRSNPKPKKAVRLSSSGVTDKEIEATLEQVEAIIEMTEQLPSDGFKFGESVADKCADIGDSIERHRQVTPAQKEALDNMEAGVARWLHD